jgi:acetyl esterase/lipase
MFYTAVSKTVVRIAVGLLALLVVAGAAGCSGSLSVIPGGMGSFTTATPTYEDLVYASTSAAQKLDLYLPEGNGPFPVVVMIHGGGFMVGDKADGMGLAGGDQLLKAGFAIASLNYRMSGEATFPAPIQDAKAAVRFLRANAAQYKLNPDRIGAWGASAGGNLASLLGTSCGVAALEGAELGNADQSSCVQAVVDWFGPIDFLALDEQFAGTSCPQDHNEASSPESKLLGAAVQTVPDLAKAANPMTYITDKAAPFFIQNGSADCNIPPVQGKNLADALNAASPGKATYTLLDGAGHGGEQFNSEANVNKVIEFLEKYLK